MTPSRDSRAGYFSPAEDWVGTKQPGDLSIKEVHDVLLGTCDGDGLDDYLVAAYDSLAGQGRDDYDESWRPADE